MKPFTPKSAFRSTLSESAFYGIVGASLIYGLALTAYITSLSLLDLTWPSLIGLSLLMFGGVIIACSTPVAAVTFLGYNMIIVPFGLMLGTFIDHYSPGTVTNVAIITALIAGLMTFLSVIYPQFFSRLGFVLFYSLLALIFVRVLQIFVPALAHLRIIDYIGAGIFSLYVGYDMYVASQVTRTVNSAIGISVSLYLDLVNLFLSLLGDSDD